MNDSKLTPMMRQFYEIKNQFQDCILFFRLGDFYEMFGDDAVISAEILDITLTSRDKGENALPMCGVPYHSAESYIAKLNMAGKKVAICEQISDTTLPGIVERKVVRVVTPGTNMSEHSLVNDLNQYICGIIQKSEKYAICFADVSTGEIFGGDGYSKLEIASLLAVYGPKEIVAFKNLAETPEFNLFASENDIQVVTAVDYDRTDQKIFEFLNKHFESISLAPYGLEGRLELAASVYLVLRYLKELLQDEVKNLNNFTLLRSNDHFDLDKMTVNNLEIFYTYRDFDRKNSFLSTIDYTKTAAGGRLLRRFVMRPLRNVEMINHRLAFVRSFTEKQSELSDVRNLLSSSYDIERILSRMMLGIANPRDIVNLGNTLTLTPELNIIIQNVNHDLQINDLHEVRDLIGATLIEDAPLSKRDAHIIKDGVDENVDEYRKLLTSGKQFIAELQKREIESTGISTLKIGFNKVFGYYIEVSKGKVGDVPESYIRKQTLTNCERYITPELKEYEEKVLHAEDNLKKIEEELFDKLVAKILDHHERIKTVASQLAITDVYSSLAELAISNSYKEPVVNNTRNLNIVAGRHPVIEKLVTRGSYVSNDLHLNSDSYLRLITGPNMGGKSTYLRQTALIVLLAQIGSFVPAHSAEIGVVDQIFSRVGASDNLSRGLSTFMVEMEETAYILRQATNHSLLILDEIGRGTSTYDGVSLAWAITEFIHNDLHARSLFATHYHELIEPVEQMPGAENLCVQVEEDSHGKPVFLHSLKKGAISKSYGIHVAEQAGLLPQIVQRAEILLKNIEGEFSHVDKKVSKNSPPANQQDLFSLTPDYSFIKRQLDKIDVNKLTPVEALIELQELQKMSLEKS